MGDNYDYENDEFFSNTTFCLLIAYPGSMLPVRDQERTNACYAFAIVDALYTWYHIAHHWAPPGSEQDFLDFCHIAYPPPNVQYHTDGSLVINDEGLGQSLTNAFEYVRNYGLCFEIHRPFLGRCEVGLTLAQRPQGPKINVGDYFIFYCFAEEEIKNGPIVTNLWHAPSFVEWELAHGIYMGPNEEEQAKIDGIEEDEKTWTEDDEETWIEDDEEGEYCLHTLLLVGYGKKDGVDYYIAKNSYGPTWGHRGYIIVAQHVFEEFMGPNGIFLSTE